MLSLTSSPKFIENQRQESSRPFFPHPWTRENNVIEISIAEELPAGHVVYSLPAINPMDGSLVPVAMQGDMERAFTFDPSTGAISIAHLLDFESMAPNDRTFSLTFKAGLDGYESMAELRITVTNVNDSPPMLEKEGVQNELAIPENLPPSTIIARLQIKDKDDPLNLENYVAEKSGHGSELYTVSVINGSFVVAVAENATLDREQLERQTVHLTVKDGAGNQDSATLSIRLLDVNDNAPNFSQDQYAMQVVDNWPPGIVVDRMRAIDVDSGKNSHVIYSLSTENAKNFAIDAVTGELSIGRELAGVAREQPYELVVVAEDAGTPSLSSSVRIKLKVSEPLMDGDEKGQVYFINPSVEYTLKVKEDTPINEHIYNVKARMAGVGEERMNIKYSLKDTLNDFQYFDIDESSGEIYVTRALDYESTKYYSVSFVLLLIQNNIVQWSCSLSDLK
ncbi:cadherin domain protein [Necator americanus]|uniref:Cadherin domain protein n=1 Tax=Necator americanus TaxID=51031 RepID=W2TMN2_NECAM|nr:cadherin domain protein [Necator americanus]ETN82396.1 cadherin domain protein [Necator americanus]